MQLTTGDWRPATVLTINSGSSSLKAALFRGDGGRSDFRYEKLGMGGLPSHAAAFSLLLAKLGDEQPVAIGHRVVFGGETTDAIRLLDEAEITRLNGLVPQAPLHLPGNLLGIRACGRLFAGPQFACYDTAFHITLPEQAKRLPIPARFGLRRYGFHGLNYAFIASQLPQLLGEAASGRIVVAHLGAGASLCLLNNGQSVDTTMGFTPFGGIPMASRPGDLDPGVVIELCRQLGIEESAELIARDCGLKALSDGESSDMATLLASDSDDARFAVDYFCQQVRSTIGAMAAKAGGIDGLIFTGGIGEHAALVRLKICEPLGFLGFELDAASNTDNSPHLHAAGSKPILLVAADEEQMIRQLVAGALQPNWMC